jgi:aminoglycoside phosphotransferase (APT) family kinase protein
MDGTDRVWLFVEAVEGSEYRPELAAHRRLAGTWLATLHVEASRLRTPALAARPYLYDVASAGIHRHLERAGTLLDEALATRPRGATHGRRLLASLSRHCELLRDHWEALRALAGTVSPTLVHGDYCVSNLLIVEAGAGSDGSSRPRGRPVASAGQPGLGMVVFDWQRSGWAAPAFDLTRFLGSWVAPDLEAYLDIAGREWRELDKTTVLRLAYVGEILRWIEAVRWELERLEHRCLEDTVSLLEIYEAWMDDIRSVAPWTDEGLLADRPWRSVVPYGRPSRLAPGAPVHR